MRPWRTAVLLALGGAGCLLAGFWIPLKAELADVLIRRAWVEAQRGGQTVVRPWPWAETWPVGRLLVPRLGVDQIVLEGAQGAALAFAPGHLDGTARPGLDGNVVLAGHRDTVFAFLADLRLDDELELVGTGGQPQRYRVVDTRIVDENDVGALAATPRPTLTLVTCYPFRTVLPRGPLRYVVVSTVDFAVGSRREESQEARSFAPLESGDRALRGLDSGMLDRGGRSLFNGGEREWSRVSPPRSSPGRYPSGLRSPRASTRRTSSSRA